MLRWSSALLCAALSGCASAAPLAEPAPPATPSPAPVSSTAARARPVPNTVVPPAEFLAAVEAGTRTLTGQPGPRYWQNWADYRLRTRVDPASKRLDGSVEIRYHNRSPDELRALVLDLTQNIHQAGAARLEEVEVTGGFRFDRVRLRGATLTADAAAAPRYEVRGTKMVIFLDRPLPAGQSVDLSVDWNFTIPAGGAGDRMGYSQDNLVYLAYFYPQMAVYDDVVGWHLDPFLGPAEFYSGFGNYDVTIEAPAGWVVVGTGDLTNPTQVLSPAVLARLRAAEQSDSVVRVVSESDFATATARPASGNMLSWSFRADSVRDVAYSLTRGSIWDAARAAVGDRDGDGRVDYTRADALYRPAARRWTEVVRYEQHALRFLSQYTGLAYPWSHMSAVEGAGIIRGGMEYPMMTLIGDYTAAGDTALYGVTAHELAHMWMPLIVATDERRYAWLDEGTTSFNENQAKRDFYPGHDATGSDLRGYLAAARTEQEGEILRHSNYHYPGPAYVVASYYKPALVMEALRGVLGEETFNRAYREIFQRWAYRHPYPWDVWNVFEQVSGQDLDWFWRSWYQETWVLDQAVESVTPSGAGTRIVVRDVGRVPMPVDLRVTTADGQTLTRRIPVDVWLGGATTAELTVPGRATRVEIDTEGRYPDADRANNAWPR